VALLKDLDNSVLLLGGAELSLEGALGGRVVGALVAVPVAMSALLLLLYVYHCIGVRYTSMVGWLGLLVGDGLGALDEDDEVLALALVVALGLGGVSAHVGCCGGWLVWVG
jgi:hypothetical protein